MQAPNPSSPSPSSSAVDSLTCQWGDCRHRCTSAETLYEHVCEKHVGRKSTNNLNLTCQWGSCRTTTVKRDHITSHIRVHVPLKPHKCDFCGKAFKRPQDLKKHVKTHADESVLLRSPEPSSSNRVPVTNGYQQNGSKHSGNMSDYTYNQNGGYNHYNPGHSHNFYGNGGASHNSNFGPVYYQVPQAASLAGGDTLESRKRGHDALNKFFGDIKRRDIDPNQYYDLGSRLGAVQSLSLPMFGGMQGLGPMDDQAGTAVAYGGSAMPTGHYPIPFSELKTKNDLMSIDQFLQQLQETVYEHPGHIAAPTPQAAAQLQAPFGQGDLVNMHGQMPADAHTPGALSTSSFANSDTPALTPNSYTQSPPSSVHSNQLSVSPVARPAAANLYPSLPSLSSINDMTPGYPPTTGAPTSGLDNSYDDFEARRRWSGGFLQRAQTVQSAPSSQESLSPRLRHESVDRDAVLAKGVGKMDISTPKPAEVGEFTRRGSPSAKSDDSDDRQEAWIQNIRVIERLRDFIQEKIKDLTGDKHDKPSSPASAGKAALPAATDEDGDHQMAENQRASSSLYPLLRPVEATS